MIPQNVKICLISSHGGHLHELSQAVKNIDGDFYWVTHKTNHTTKILQGKQHCFVIDPNVQKWKFLLNAFQSFFHLLKFRPKVIISTGSGIAIPTILLGKYLFRCKIIFIESVAAVTTPSKTGSFIYKYSDLFLIQWEELKTYFPKSKHIGVL